MDEKGLGHRLQVARQAAGLTQQGLCQKANLSYSTLAKIERGAIKAPSIFTIERIAEAIGTTLDELIGRHPIEPNISRLHMQSRSGVKFVYFDINGCLVRSYHRAFMALVHDSGQPEDVIETTYWHYNDQVCRGDMNMADFNRELAKRLHMNSLNWADYYLKAIEPMPEMAGLVTWVSENYRIGLMTNIMPGLLTSMRQRSIIPDLNYDAIIDSSEVRAIKPEAKMYEVGINRSGVRPNEILLIDDDRANIMAGERFGLHVLWFDDSRPEESVKRIKNTLEPINSSELVDYQPESPALLPLVSQNVGIPG